MQAESDIFLGWTHATGLDGIDRYQSRSRSFTPRSGRTPARPGTSPYPGDATYRHQGDAVYRSLAVHWKVAGHYSGPGSGRAARWTGGTRGGWVTRPGYTCPVATERGAR